MRPRHAAALALVGWYLLMPPVESEGLGLVCLNRNGRSACINHKAPLSKWNVIKSFKTVTECEDYRAFFMDKAKKDFPMNGIATKEAELFAFAATTSVCIASDDPRLKEK